MIWVFVRCRDAPLIAHTGLTRYYKSGWNIEKEFAEKEKKRQNRLQKGKCKHDFGYVVPNFLCTDPNEESDKAKKVVSEKNEQFACIICRGPFSNAVETM
ncbi:hypothetical protein PsorP6_013659 [Peronosclerospora sorghi]|uniref:Uncharacterized protein n=1 Tax=Peronosclerospora sorghi TaxID=230839 RepID=A0ACC0VHQ1_9STRA|nr:hypothetical protein PsorP6_013659 [Peronosclerospora sorghi]